MPDNDEKTDPFKPQQPRIPGVKAAAREEKPAEVTADSAHPSAISKLQDLHLPPRWILATVAGALVLGGMVAWWSRGSSAKEPELVAASVPTQAPVEPAKPPERLPIAPGEVATTDELAEPWAAKRFIFRDPGTSRDTLGIVVRLPGDTYWGLSLREPYGTCEMEYVTDLQKLETEYHYRASHPMVGDPCNKTVFDLSRYGNAPSGLVRGEIAQGAGVRPPMAIEIRTKGKQILAVRME
ncbi:MAG: hypothetical protein ACRD5M_06480 [Candidatus Acidiferrales bacterium]